MKNLILRKQKKLVLSVIACTIFTLFLGTVLAQEGAGDDLAPKSGKTENSNEDKADPIEEGQKVESQQTNGENAIEGTETTASGVLWRNKESSQLYANSHVRFTLTAVDNVSRTDYIEYKDNDGDIIRYASPFTLAKEGPHNIVYHAVDRAGNREFDHTFNVIIDDSAPEVDLIPARAFVDRNGRHYTSLGNTFTIRAFDRYSGIKSVSYSVNSGAKTEYVDGNTIQLSQAGPQLIQYDAVDNLNNSTKGSSVLVEVDDTRPTVTIRPTQPLRLVDGASYARRATGFNVIGEDSMSGIAQIMVRIDGSQQWQAYNGTLYFTTETEHSIEAKAVDGVGNESSIVSTKFKVDDNPPITNIETSVQEGEATPAPTEQEKGANKAQ